MPEPLPTLEGFDSKERESQLAIVFLLASAFGQIQEELYSATWDLDLDLEHYISALAAEFVAAVPRQIEPMHAVLTWESFVARQRASRIPKKVEALLDRGRATIDRALQAGFDPRRFLAEANEGARAAVETLAAIKIGLTVGIPVQRARIRILWREGGGLKEFSWPSTTVGEHRITWFFQLHASAFRAALAADSILRHEYLSHVLPQSDSLSNLVREGWLMQVLAEELRDPRTPGKFLAFEHVRPRLGRPGTISIETVAQAMFLKRPDLYWSLTRDLLALPPGAEPASRVDTVIMLMLQFGGFPPLSRFLEDPRLTGLDSLYAAVER